MKTARGASGLEMDRDLNTALNILKKKGKGWTRVERKPILVAQAASKFSDET